MDHVYAHQGRGAISRVAKPHEDYLRPYSQMRDAYFDLINVRLFPLHPPYYPPHTLDPLQNCGYCAKGPDFAEAGALSGKSAVVRWAGSDNERRTLFVRDSGKRRKVFFQAQVQGSSAAVENLPADFREIVLDLRSWRADGSLERTVQKSLSLPERMMERKTPALAGDESPKGPHLEEGLGFVVAGHSAKISWNAQDEERFDVLASTHPNPNDATSRFYKESTTKTTTVITGLPADCRLVYIHIEGLTDGEWRGNSYAIFSAPEGYKGGDCRKPE